MRRRARRDRLVRRMAITILLVLVIAVLALRFYMSRDDEDRLKRSEVVDFAALDLPRRSNAFLLCPQEPARCSLAADAPSPVFPLDVNRLRDRWLEMMAREKRVRMIAADTERHHLVFVQRSAFFRFPDIITVEFIPIDEDHSTLALLSRSRYGRSDFGVNAARVKAWIARLQAMVAGGA